MDFHSAMQGFYTMVSVPTSNFRSFLFPNKETTDIPECED